MAGIVSRSLAAMLLISATLLPLPGAFGQTSFPADGGNWETEQRIEEALARSGSIDFVEIPLLDVVQELNRQFEVQIVLPWKKLEEASIRHDTPITKKLDNLTLESILGLILKDLELVIAVRDEVLMITTPEDAEARLQARVYPVLDLVSFSKPGQDPDADATDYDSLIEMIKATIRPDSWDDVGGPGSIAALPNAGTLAISQTRASHKATEGLLMALRHAKKVQGLTPAAGNTTHRASSRTTTWPTRRQTAAQAEAWQRPHVHPAADEPPK